MKIERVKYNRIRIEEESSHALIQSQSVESNLLYAILEKLEEIRCCVIDVEMAVNNGPD